MADIVQIYVQLPNPEMPDRLIDFTRIEVQAGHDRAFVLRIPVDRLATRDPEAHAWQSPAGRHRITVARHAGDPDGVAIEIDL